MTPPDQLQQGSPQGSSLFGGGGESSQREAQQSASKQLITEMATVHSGLKGLAKAHPEMAESVDAAIKALNAGMNRAVSAMQTRESEGSQPTYA